MKVAVFTMVFFLVLSFFAFGQNATVQDAYNAGFSVGYISSVPYPSNIPERYRQNSGLERAYMDGHKKGYDQKKSDELANKGFKVEPIFDSTEERTNPGRPETTNNNSVGIEFKWPF